MTCWVEEPFSTIIRSQPPFSWFLLDSRQNPCLSKNGETRSLPTYKKSWVVPPPSNCGKFTGIPYWKCNNPGGDCYWEGRQPKKKEKKWSSREVAKVLPMLGRLMRQASSYKEKRSQSGHVSSSPKKTGLKTMMPRSWGSPKSWNHQNHKSVGLYFVWLVVSNIFYVHPYLGKIPNLTSIFFRWVETTN